MAIYAVAAVLCVTFFAGMGTAKAADESSNTATIDTGRTGSITVTKYGTTDENHADMDGDATGKTANIDSNQYTTLDGVEFELYRVDNADISKYYDGSSGLVYAVDGEGKVTYNGEKVAKTKCDTQTTANGGVCTFTDLELGIYVLIEASSPSQVSEKCVPTLVSIPMVNTAESNNTTNSWIYDVKVYPKNTISPVGTLKLKKTDNNGAALSNVSFELWKNDLNSDGTLKSQDWEKVDKTTDENGNEKNLSLTTDESGELTIDNLPAELYGTQYKLIETSAPAGYVVNMTEMYFKVKNNSTIEWNDSKADVSGCNNTNNDVEKAKVSETDSSVLNVELKNEIPSLVKNVYDASTGTWKNDTDYQLGVDYSYMIKVRVPANIANLNKFEIKDTPDSGITDKTDTIKVYVEGDSDVELKKAIDYTVSASEAGGFTITFENSGKTKAADKNVKVVYSACLNANAVVAGVGNGNAATLTYSSYITSDETNNNKECTITDATRVYTYKCSITKKLDSENGSVAQGVEFNLLSEKNGSPMNVVGSNGVYRVALPNDTETTTVLSTNESGNIIISGLDNTTYYLKETKTVAGYNLLSEPFAVNVNVVETTSWTPSEEFAGDEWTVNAYDKTTYTVDSSNVDEPTISKTIINKRGFVLPKTGSMGFILFCFVGLALIAGGAMLIFGGRRKKIK